MDKNLIRFNERVNEFWSVTPVFPFAHVITVTKLNKVYEFINLEDLVTSKNNDVAMNVKAQNKICVLSDSFFANATYDTIFQQPIDKQITMYFLKLNTLYYKTYVLKAYTGDEKKTCVLLMLECYSALEEMIKTPVDEEGRPLVNKITKKPVLCNAKDLLFSIQRYFYTMLIYMEVYPYHIEKIIEDLFTKKVEGVVTGHIDLPFSEDNIYLRLLKQKGHRIVRSFDVYLEHKLKAEVRIYRLGDASKYVNDIRFSFTKGYCDFKYKNKDNNFIQMLLSYQAITEKFKK